MKKINFNFFYWKKAKLWLQFSTTLLIKIFHHCFLYDFGKKKGLQFSINKK